jgi:hypothetical protein
MITISKGGATPLGAAYALKSEFLGRRVGHWLARCGGQTSPSPGLAAPKIAGSSILTIGFSCFYFCHLPFFFFFLLFLYDYIDCKVRFFPTLLDISEDCFTDLGATAEQPFEPHFGHQRDRDVSAAVCLSPRAPSNGCLTWRSCIHRR